MAKESYSRQEVLGFNLNLFARGIGCHLFLADKGLRVPHLSLHRPGICGLGCARGLEPCVSTCLRPPPRSLSLEVARISRCPLGFITFSCPLRVRGEPAGVLGGGGLASFPGFLPKLSRLVPLPADEASLREFERLVPEHRVLPTRELMSTLGGVKATFESLLTSHQRQDEAETRVRQVEGLSSILGGLYSDLPPVEWAPSFLRSLALLFDIPALFVAFPRPFLPGLFLFESFGEAARLPGARGVNLPEPFPRPEGIAGGWRFEDDPVRLRHWGLPPGTRSASLFVVGAAGHTLGVIAALDRPFTPEEAVIVRNAAGAFALNLLVTRMERSEEDMREERGYLLSLVQDLLQEEDPDRIYALLLRKVRSVTGAEKASLMLPDGEGSLKVRKAEGIEDGLLEGFAVQPGEGIAGQVFASGVPLWVRDLEKDLPGPARQRSHYKTRSFISFPLMVGGRPEGVLNLSDKDTGTPFNRKDFDRVKAISEHSQLALARVRYLERYREALHLAATDPLTGLANRRDLVRRVEAEIERAARRGGEVSVVMVDVDHFKEYNDKNGHQAGDDALRVIGAVLLQAIRGMDLASRYGGEEFCLVLPEVGEEGALQAAERVRLAVEHTVFPGEEALPSGKLTVSLGVAVHPRIPGNARELIYASDMALYRAKRGGRNMVCAAGGGEEAAWHPGTPAEPPLPSVRVPR